MRRSSVTNRQSLLPLRVQDSSKASLITPQKKDRQGFGKLSMTKPVSGTSERKTSFFGKRTSSGTSRNSLYGTFGAAEKIKDPRPVHDKAFIQQCIRQLCEFLNENGYSPAVTVKSLQGPSTKDFLKIFTFLISFICPDYEIPDSKFEEEIPRMFKELGYPFVLSKSSMYTVGAPHTWPQIVVALVWLLDTIQTACQKMNENEFGDPQIVQQSDNGVEFNKVFVDYSVRCYNRFMDGHDTFEDQEAEVQAKLKENYNVDDSHKEFLLTESRRLAEEIEKLEKEKDNEPDRLASLRKRAATLKTDVLKYQHYLTEIESHCSLLDQRVGGLVEQVETVALDNEAIRQENLSLKNILDNQEYSVADIERIKYEENELQQTITKLTKAVDEHKQNLWSEELKYAKIKESIDTQITEFHKVARKLRMIPSNAVNARGYDFQIQYDLDTEQGSFAQYKSTIPVALVEIQSQIEGQITGATNQKMRIEDMIEQFTTLLSENKNDAKTLKDEMQKLDEFYQQESEKHEENEREQISDLESLNKHLQLIGSGVNKTQEESTKELQNAKQEFQLVEHKTEEELRQVNNKLVRVFNAVASHVEIIEKELEHRHLRADRLFEEFNKEDLLCDLRELLERYKEKAEVLDVPIAPST